MRTIHTLHEAGPDKTLWLTIPVKEANRRYRVTFVIEPDQPPASQPVPLETGWPPGFVEQTAGSIQDDTFFRHPQGEYEQRLDFDS